MFPGHLQSWPSLDCSAGLACWLAWSVVVVVVVVVVAVVASDGDDPKKWLSVAVVAAR